MDSLKYLHNYLLKKTVWYKTLEQTSKWSLSLVPWLSSFPNSLCNIVNVSCLNTSFLLSTWVWFKWNVLLIAVFVQMTDASESLVNVDDFMLAGDESEARSGRGIINQAFGGEWGDLSHAYQTHWLYNPQWQPEVQSKRVFSLSQVTGEVWWLLGHCDVVHCTAAQWTLTLQVPGAGPAVQWTMTF